VATLRDIRRRIRSRQKTMQITSAMRMVSAAKLRRAQDAILAARPFAMEIWATMYDLGRRQPDLEHPLLKPHAAKRSIEFVVVTSDRGLCGAFNTNVLKAAQAEIAKRGAEFEQVSLATVGRKGSDFFRRRRPPEKSWLIGNRADPELARDIAQHVASRYESGAVDEVVFVGSEFVSALTQQPQAIRVLPLVPEASRARSYEEGAGTEPFSIEPDPQQLLGALVPLALQFSVYRALLESQAGEHAARMTAMESATRNAEELIQSLTLQFNRARQAVITKELVEIVSGAEALA
jgi:F-type H+-transporting ATPase subunit gamma